jgi:diguanylate cyclase (GGDEF)-like protein
MTDGRMATQHWMRSTTVKRLGQLTLLTAAYFVAGKLGVRLSYFPAGASPVWPAAGIALAGLVLLGLRAWPAVLIGALLVNLTTTGAVATSSGIAIGNTLEAVLGAYLVVRWVGGPGAFGRTRRAFKFTVLTAGVSAIGATLGATTLSLSDFAPWTAFGFIWVTRWLGHFSGDLVVGTVILLWITHPEVRWSRGKTAEGAGVFLGLLLACLFVFSPLSPAAVQQHSLEFLCLPPLLWAALRLGPREAATAVLVLAAFATWGTLSGLGPFARETSGESLLLLQAFTCVAAVMTLLAAAVVSERRYVEERLRALSVSDPLTGLANHRRLVAVLESEIQRSGRTGEPFALLFLDLDELKAINDRHGHLVGSRALCRLANVLRATCRAVDTAARYGGDEFAVVLPETSEPAAQEVARRVAARLALDAEHPPLTASMGVAVFPLDGQSAETLIGTADRILYDMKRARLEEAR